MIAKRTAEMAREKIAAWCRRHRIYPRDVADLLRELEEVPGSKSWKESVAGLRELLEKER